MEIWINNRASYILNNLFHSTIFLALRPAAFKYCAVKCISLNSISLQGQPSSISIYRLLLVGYNIKEKILKR